MSVPDPLYIQAQAIVASSRPGALNPLDPNIGISAPLARLWAEPINISATIELLEALDFEVISTDRFGVHFMAPSDAFASAFKVKPVWLKPKSGAPRWRINDTTGKQLEVIPPISAEQSSLIRGIVLPVPLSPAVVKSKADYENDFKNAKATDYQFQTLPHQLRRELCTNDPGADPKFPTGKGVKVVVVDTGFDGSHPYWKAVGLDQAAARVKIEPNGAYLGARKVAISRLVKQYNGLQRFKIDLLQTFEPVRLLGIYSEPADINRYINAFEKLSDAMHSTVFGGTELSADLAELNAFELAINEQKLSRRFYHMALSIFAKLELLYESHLDDIRDRRQESYDAPHGTEVIGQLLAVAPDVDVTVIQTMRPTDHTMRGAASRHLAGFVMPFDSIVEQITKDIRADCVSLSIAHDFENNPGGPIWLRGKAAIAHHQQFVDKLDAFDCLVIQCSVNLDRIFEAGTKKQNPGQGLTRRKAKESVSVPHFVRGPNFVTVGGAYWTARHDLVLSGKGKAPKAVRKLRPSNSAIGFHLPAAPGPGGDPIEVKVPDICGLVGPSFDTAAKDMSGGLSIAPIQVWDGAKWAHKMQPVIGTSFSTPQVCGVAAILLERFPDLFPSRLRHRMIDSATEIPWRTKKEKTFGFAQPTGSQNILALTRANGKPGMVDLATAIAKPSVIEQRKRAAKIEQLMTTRILDSLTASSGPS